MIILIWSPPSITITIIKQYVSNQPCRRLLCHQWPLAQSQPRKNVAKIACWKNIKKIGEKNLTVLLEGQVYRLFDFLAWVHLINKQHRQRPIRINQHPDHIGQHQQHHLGHPQAPTASVGFDNTWEATLLLHPDITPNVWWFCDKIEKNISLVKKLLSCQLVCLYQDWLDHWQPLLLKSSMSSSFLSPLSTLSFPCQIIWACGVDYKKVD